MAQTYGTTMRTSWFAGTIARVSDDGTRCDVHYDDGDKEEGVPLRFLRCLPSSTSAVRGRAQYASPEAPAELPPTPPLPPPPTSLEVSSAVFKPISVATDPEPTTPRPSLLGATPHSPPERASSPGSNLRARMVELLHRTLSPLGLSDAHYEAIVDGIKCNRTRFRAVRHNLKHSPTVAEAYVRGEMPLERIIDLSAFARARAGE